VALEAGRPEVAFGQLLLLFRDPAQAATPGPALLSSMAYTASGALRVLPDTALDAVATWPPGFAAEVAEQTRCFGCSAARYDRLVSLAAKSGRVEAGGEARVAPSIDERVTDLVRDCASESGVSEGGFDLEVDTFASGPPQARVRGAISPGLAGCLRDRVVLYFGSASAGARARVKLGAELSHPPCAAAFPSAGEPPAG